MLTSSSITISSGTPQQLAAKTPPTIVTRVLIQCQPGSSDGEVYVFVGVPPGTTPSTNSYPYVTLAAGTSNTPSDTYNDRVDEADDFGFDLSTMWVDGSHTGDLVTVLINRKV